LLSTNLLSLNFLNFISEIAMATDLCRRLDLSTDKCEILEGYLSNHCKLKVAGAIRQRSRWQECIATRRAGKKFDPEAIKQLAKEYHEGKCP